MATHLGLARKPLEPYRNPSRKKKFLKGLPFIVFFSLTRDLTRVFMTRATALALTEPSEVFLKCSATLTDQEVETLGKDSRKKWSFSVVMLNDSRRFHGHDDSLFTCRLNSVFTRISFISWIRRTEWVIRSTSALQVLDFCLVVTVMCLISFRVDRVDGLVLNKL